MSPLTFPRWALVHGDGCFIFISERDVRDGEGDARFAGPARGELTVQCGAQVATKHPTRDGWWWFDGDAPQQVQVGIRKAAPLLHYALDTDSVAIKETYPPTLTRGEYHARIDDDEPEYDPAVSRIYRSVFGDPEWRHVVLDGFEPISGEPPEDDGLRWAAELPYALAGEPQYAHLFPGHFEEDFWKAVAAEVGQNIAVKHVYEPKIHKNGAHLEVGVAVAYDPPREHWHTPRGPTGRKRKRELRPTVTQVTVKLQVPQRVEGTNRLVAKAERERMLAAAVQQVADQAAVKLCGHCNGVGVIPISRKDTP